GGMTFGLALANRDYVIQVSDRRLTALNGELVDDSANKAGHIICDDSSLLYCYTGLARWGTRSTSQWLLETFQNLGGHTYWEVIEGFAESATTYFKTAPKLKSLSPSVK